MEITVIYFKSISAKVFGRMQAKQKTCDKTPYN